MAMLDRKNQAVNEYFDKQIPEMTKLNKYRSHGGVPKSPSMIKETIL